MICDEDDLEHAGCRVTAEDTVSQEELFDECVALGKKVQADLMAWLAGRLEVANQLRKIADALEKVCRDVSIARVTGASVSVAGGVIGVVGGVLTFFTFGAALPLAIAGAVISASGGLTSGISQLVQKVMSSKEMKVAQAVIEGDKQRTIEMQDLIKKLYEQCLVVQVNGITSVEDKIAYFIFHAEYEQIELLGVTAMLTDVERQIPIPQTAFQVVVLVGTFVGTVTSVTRNAIRIAARTAAGVATEAAAGASSAVRAGMTTSVKVVAGASIAVGGIAMIFDVVDIVQASVALAKDGKTDSSRQLIETADDIERVVEHMIKLFQSTAIWFHHTVPIIGHLDRYTWNTLSAQSSDSAENKILDYIIEQQEDIDCAAASLNFADENPRHLLNIIKLIYETVRPKLTKLRKKSLFDENSNSSNNNNINSSSEYVDDSSTTSTTDTDPSDTQPIIAEDVSDSQDGGGNADTDAEADETADTTTTATDFMCNVNIFLMARCYIDDCWQTGSRLVDLPGINDVILYQPWNCTLDDRVAFNILCHRKMGSKRHQVTGCTLQNCNAGPMTGTSSPSLNRLARAREEPIPRIMVEPVCLSVNELTELKLDLEQYDQMEPVMNGWSDSQLTLILPYCVDDNSSQYVTNVKLSSLCLAVGAVCRLFNMTATVHLLGNLTNCQRDSTSQIKHKSCAAVGDDDSKEGRPTTMTYDDFDDDLDMQDFIRFKQHFRHFVSCDGAN